MSRYIFSSMATLGYLGYLPAPGTMGSLFAFVLFIIFRYLNIFKYNWIESSFLILIIILSYFIIKLSFNDLVNNENNIKKYDPKEIIIDEVAGCFVALYQFNNLTSLALGFLAFRFFDITKILGIKRLENSFIGPFGILVDDLVAGIYANILIRILIIFV